jgi:hypothetical protein
MHPDALQGYESILALGQSIQDKIDSEVAANLAREETEREVEAEDMQDYGARYDLYRDDYDSGEEEIECT